MNENKPSAESIAQMLSHITSENNNTIPSASMRLENMEM
jgi:hypothetical protein